MISSYLFLVFTQCKSLVESPQFDGESVVAELESKTKEVLVQLDLNTEQELIHYLQHHDFSVIRNLLESHPFLYIFYLINSIAEHRVDATTDELGRFRYQDSVQKQIGVEENLVLQLIHHATIKNDVLSRSFRIKNHASYIFLSHDIDSVNGSFLQDGMWALKNGRFDILLKLFANVVLQHPGWLNMDLIMDLESEYDFKSTFYWLVNKGRIDKRQTNADYTISSGEMQKVYRRVEERGFENGLHKSISSDDFVTELGKLPSKVSGNRFHYLKFNVPDAYQNIESSGLKLDASLGFAEHHGFRNSYGYPFSPYNFEKNTVHSFVEVPLNIMDGSFQRYKGIPVEKTANTVIAFLETNKQNCLLSLLWHNTFFSNYKYRGYRNEYIKILQYLRESSFININQSGIIREFSWKKKS
ncbi:MAG: hypothetical protein PSX36_00485 [bacterium]|nr:hypothetical protein [bacterium]